MKQFLACLVVVGLSGCATEIPYSAQEECALDGLKFVGVDKSNSSGVASGYAWGEQTRNMNYVSSSIQVRCEIPKTEAEKVEISTLQKSVRPKVTYNRDVGTRKVVTGIGWLLYAVPGFILYMVFDDERTEAVTKSHEIERSIAAEAPKGAPSVGH